MSEQIKKERNKKTNFTGSFGNIFQVDACIFMYLKYAGDCKCFGFEGGEDFEFITKNGKRHYFQAKSATKRETIEKKDQYSQIKSAIESFSIVNEKENSTYNIIFNYKTPFLKSRGFSSLGYEKVSFGSDELKDEKQRYIDNKISDKIDFPLDKIDFHYLQYDETTKSAFIHQEIQNFIFGNNIYISPLLLESRWFTLITRNSNEPYYIDAGVMAGTVFNLVAQTHDLKRIVTDLNRDIYGEPLDKLIKAFLSYFDTDDLPFTESNLIRSDYFSFTKVTGLEDSYNTRMQFIDDYISTHDMPMYFNNFFSTEDELLKTLLLPRLFKAYIYVILDNETEIRKIKGVFGYGN